MKKTITFIFLLLLGFLLVYSNLPVFNYGFVGFAFILLILVVLAILFSTGFAVSGSNNQLKVVSKPSRFLVYAFLVVFGYCTVLPFVTSLKMFRSDSYQKLLGTVKNGQKITNHIEPSRFCLFS